MSELKIDNPALRLLNVLEQGQRHPASTSCREVWIALLLAQNLSEYQLLSRLARVMELPERIEQVREVIFPHSGINLTTGGPKSRLHLLHSH